MGLLGLVGFALQCFDVLAWPLFALVYPLYSSVRAIETNSITDTQKINTYWVVFSLILLFEHAFMKLLEWFLLWPYIKLLIVFFLVMPHFDGALYVYQHLICPCLSMDPQIVISLFNKRKESLVRDNFLSEVEGYVKETGPEGLEKFIACKSTRTNLNVKEFNAVSSMDNEASKSIKANGGQNDIKAVQEMVKKKETTASQVSQAEPNLTVNEDKFSSRKMNEKIIEVAANREILNTPPPKKVQKEWTKVSPLPTQTDATFNSPLGDNKHKATNEALKMKNEVEPKFTGPENRTVAAMETYEKLVEVGIAIEDPEPPKEVQKEWTCALCQVTTTCERNLNSHLRGRKHKAAYEALKAGNQAFVPKIAPASTAKTSNQPNKEPGKSIPKKMKMKMKMCKARKIVVQLHSQRSNPAMARKGSKQKVTINENVQGQKNSSPAPITKKQSSNGQKGKIAIQVEKVQSQQPKPNEVPRVKSSPLHKVQSQQPKPNEVPRVKSSPLRKVQSQQPKPNEVPRVKSSPLQCAICRIRCAGEIDMLSHLNGRKHKENVQERQKRT